MTPPPHPAQQIASGYLRQWLAQVGKAPALYVEGFATVDSAERVRSLPEGAQALLFQEDPVLAAQLRALVPGSVAEVIEASFAEGTSLVAERAAAVPNSLVILNPAAPGHLPLDAIRMLAAIPSVDLWIRFPHGDLGKLARFRSTPMADLPPYARRIVEGYGRLLNDPRGSWLAEWRRAEAEQGSRVAEQGVARRFNECLAGAAEGKTMKNLDLDQTDTGPLYLACVTSDPMRALVLNVMVEKMGLSEQVRWAAGRFRRLRLSLPPVAEPLDFFAGGGATTSATLEYELADDALAGAIGSHFLGRTVSLGDVVRELLVMDVLPDDVRSALRLLRHGGRAVYRSLKTSAAEITFPALPVAPRARVRSANADTLELLPEHTQPG
jgi:hypothetical protein